MDNLLHIRASKSISGAISTLNNSAAGHDGIPAFIMKQCINDYITPLTHLINLSINEGTFPDELKISKSNLTSILGEKQFSALINSTKYLVLIIDDKLKWTAHIQYIKN